MRRAKGIRDYEDSMSQWMAVYTNTDLTAYILRRQSPLQPESEINYKSSLVQNFHNQVQQDSSSTVIYVDAQSCTSLLQP